MNFQTNNSELQATIISATKKGATNGMIPVVAITKLSAKARKSTYGFHFAKEEDINNGVVKVGDVQTLEHGYVRRIEAIIN